MKKNRTSQSSNEVIFCDSKFEVAFVTSKRMKTFNVLRQHIFIIFQVNSFFLTSFILLIINSFQKVSILNFELM